MTPDYAFEVITTRQARAERDAAADKTLRFDTFPEAFDYCREKDEPVVVIIEGERWKLYPSGHAKKLTPTAAAFRLGTILQDPDAPAPVVNAALSAWRKAAGYEDDPLKEAEDDLYAAQLAYRRNPDPDGQAEIDAAQKRLDDARADLEAFQLGNLRYEPVGMATSNPNYIRGETR